METSKESEFRSKPHDGWIGMVLGGALIAGYFVVAGKADHFVDPMIDYFTPENLRPVGQLRAVYLANDFKTHALIAPLFKILLLLPGTLVATAGLARLMPTRHADRLLQIGRRLKPSLVLPCAFILVYAFLLLWSRTVLQGQVVFDDERAYAFQAEVFKQGRLWADPPPVPELFQNKFIILTKDRWAGKYTAGHSLLLALGGLVGFPRLAPFALASATPLLFFLIGRDLFDRRAGLLGAGLLSISPMFLLTASTLMSHATTLFFLALFSWIYLRGWRTPGALLGLAAGLVIGFAFVIRPQAAVGFAFPFALLALAAPWLECASKPRGHRVIWLIGLIGGWAIFCALQLAYNHALTGSAFTFPFMDAANQGQQVLGFGPYGSPGNEHTPALAVAYAAVNGLRLNEWLFGWPLSLMFVVIFFLVTRPRAVDAFGLAVMGSVLVVYGLFGGPGVQELGPRYYFPLLIPLVFWTARGAEGLHRMIARLAPVAGRAAVPTFLILMVALGWLSFGFEKALHFLQLTDFVAAPYKYVEKMIAEHDLAPAVVQIRTRQPSGWVTGLRPNRPDLSDEVLIVRQGPESELHKLARVLPNHAILILDFDIREGAGRYRLQRLLGTAWNRTAEFDVNPNLPRSGSGARSQPTASNG